MCSDEEYRLGEYLDYIIINVQSVHYLHNAHTVLL